MVQSWLPWLTERTLQTHCWFLSSLVPYWLGFGVLFKYVIWRHMTTAWVAVTWCVLLALLPFVYMIVAGIMDGGEGDWYSRTIGRPRRAQEAKSHRRTGTPT